MSASLEVQGLDEIIAKYENRGKKLSLAENSAVKKGGQIILNAMKDKLGGHIRTGELIDGLTISGVKNSGGVKYVEVGINKGDNSKIFYGKFLEWGTSKMKPIPFKQPAVEEKQSEVLEAMKQELLKGLKNAS